MSENLKKFLQNKIEDLRKEIYCLKRKNLTIRILHGGLLIVSIVSATIVTIIAPLNLASIVITCASSLSAISTSLSMKFNFKQRREKLSKATKKLNDLNDRLDFFVHCSDDLSEEQCNNILKEL